jgi:hypothetical protein
VYSTVWYHRHSPAATCGGVTVSHIVAPFSHSSHAKVRFTSKRSSQTDSPPKPLEFQFQVGCGESVLFLLLSNLQPICLSQSRAPRHATLTSAVTHLAPAQLLFRKSPTPAALTPPPHPALPRLPYPLSKRKGPPPPPPPRLMIRLT